MNKVVDAILERIEEKNGVKILVAIEAGSRAWGFASDDSDYDIRFVYVRPAKHYLRVFDKFPDTLTADEELAGLPEGLYDAVGWDVGKALRLFRACNPQLLEWVYSPIVYKQHENFAYHLKRAGEEVYRKSPMIYHYRHMAANNYKDVILKNPRLKKYLYVIRPVIACRYVIQWGEVPPVNFEEALEAVEDLSCGPFEDAQVRQEVAKLLEWKRTTLERDEVGRLEFWDEYLDLALLELQKIAPEKEEPSMPTASFNQMFLNAIALFDEE